MKLHMTAIPFFKAERLTSESERERTILLVEADEDSFVAIQANKLQLVDRPRLRIQYRK